MTEGTRSLHRKLAQIMYEADRIPKNGKAPPAMGGFAFVQVGDAADYIRKALGEHVITMMPTAVRIINQADRQTKAGGSMTTVDIVTDWTLTDGESGESIVIQSFGAGADAGDKYSGKAQTNAMKYALLMGFLLSTGDDPELGDVRAKAAARPVSQPATMPAARRQTAAAEVADIMATVDPLAGARAIFDEPPLPDAPAEFEVRQIIPPAPHGGWSEGQVHTPGHKGLRARQNGHLFCPTRLPDGGWCAFRTDAPA